VNRLSLRARIVVLYVTIATVLALCVVGIVGWFFGQAINASSANVVRAAAREAPDVVAYYVAQTGSLVKAAPAIAEHYRLAGIDAFVVRDPLSPMAPPPPRGIGLPFLQLTPPTIVNVPGGVLVLHANAHRSHTALAFFWILAGSLVALVIIASAVGANVLARHLLEPLTRTTLALDRFGDGDFAQEIVSTNDRSELGNLARAYNRAVAEIVRAFDERAQTEAEMRQFIADAGHQLRTPLTVIVGHLSAMAFRPNDERTTRILDNMLHESRRMRTLIEDLIELARLEDPSPSAEVTELADVVRQTVETFSAGYGEQRVFMRALHDVDVVARRAEVESALTTLVENALAYGRQSEVEIAMETSAGEVAVTVSDRGPGMSEADFARAFDRFYRGSASDGIEGNGLGLAIARRIAQRADGRLELCNRDGGGLVCRFVLPRLSAANGSLKRFPDKTEILKPLVLSA
jgi:signal transduction histidine kinase